MTGSFFNRIFIAVFLLSFCFFKSISGCPKDDSVKRTYNKAFTEIESMLVANRLSFKRAVFVTENAYFDDTLAYDQFENKIQYLVFWAKRQAKFITLDSYPEIDSELVKRNMAIFAVLKDTCKIYVSNTQVSYHFPFTYDFTDMLGKDRWTKMFVTKLLVTSKGNCHSLPYLYKILADELEIKNAWLSFAPNHIYIKNHCLKTGWYNTELTSGQFPVDAWIMASGYISTDAVRSGIYMDTLSDRQSIANCALDLAQGYERKFKNYTDSFIIKCCNLALKYHPTNINAIVYKAETLKKMYLTYKKENPALALAIYPDMEKLYVYALDLGYKEMPEKMYKDWLLNLSRQINKYSDVKLKSKSHTLR
jgi:hypothetical protein